MSQIIAGTWNGTGAAVYICPGFIPDEVRLWAVEDSELAKVTWGREFRAAESDNGYVSHGGAQGHVLYTAGQGVEPYVGGDVLTATEQTSTDYGEGVYLGWDHKDYRQDSAYGYSGNSVIDTWTLTTSGNRTGRFNADTPASVSRIGEGSRILIEEDVTGLAKWAVVEALTAGQGITDDEVTLSLAIASGKIRFISGLYSMAPIAIGQTTPKGFKLSATTEINVNDEINAFTAIKYDN